ncbi:MAG TPA: M23 family metallopeptidase [Micromonospora sp.]
MGSHRRMPLALVIAMAVAMVALPSAPVQADPRDDKARIDAEVAKASAILESATERAQAAARRLAAATAALPAAQSRVAEARGRVAAAEAAANTARRKAAEAQMALHQAQQRYQESERRVQQARERVGSFVTANYKGSGLVTMNVLIDARTPLELAERFGYFERVMASEQAALDELLAARMAAKRTENEAALKQREAAEAQAAAEQALEDAKRAQAEAEAAAAAVQALIDERQSALDVAEQEREASLARYQRAKEEAARIARQLAAWEAQQQRKNQSGSAPSWQPGARLLMPTKGWKSSDFGMRYDPYYHVWQQHDGIDIAAPGGAPIYAAADGTVVWAGWNGGYGNFTCISHGRYNGQWLSTCYAHQSAINVQVGQQVRAGQVIGRVGTTGASTGYHLHFEVRLNGTPVQPLNWLPACLC